MLKKFHYFVFLGKTSLGIIMARFEARKRLLVAAALTSAAALGAIAMVAGRQRGDGAVAPTALMSFPVSGVQLRVPHGAVGVLRGRVRARARTVMRCVVVTVCGRGA